MKLIHVDLYDYFGKPRPAAGAGYLSCYLPSEVQHPGFKRLRPAILVLPGGGYGGVSDREAEPVALRFLTKGYGAFVLNYSVAPVRFPHALREAAMAMRYIRENAAELGIIKNMVAATGFSAGGHLCGTLGMMFDAPELQDIAPAEVIRPDALGLCYPVAVSWGRTHEGSFQNLCGDDEALWQRLSLDRLVRKDMPPAFIWHTRDDTCVPCRNSLILAQTMEEMDIPFVLHIYRSGWHGLSTADEQVYPVKGVPYVSHGTVGWLEAEMEFFREMGIFVRDLEA